MNILKARNWLESEGFVNPHEYIASMEEKEKVGYPLEKELTINEYFDRERLLQETKEKFERECRLCNDSEMCKIVKRFWGGYMFAATSKEQLLECIGDCRKCVFVSEELIENTGTLAMRKSKYRKEHDEASKKIKLLENKIRIPPSKEDPFGEKEWDGPLTEDVPVDLPNVEEIYGV